MVVSCWRAFAQATTTKGRQRERQRAALVLLNEAGIFAAPALYAPAGGVSGRTTLATIVWLMAWAVLHNRWKSREIAPGGVGAVTLFLIAAGVLGTFPPVWGLL